LVGLVRERLEELAAVTAATTPGSRSIPIDSSPARAASASKTVPVINVGLGHLPAENKASRATPAPKSATYHHAGEWPCPRTMAT
jgi:hypothetical protein